MSKQNENMAGDLSAQLRSGSAELRSGSRRGNVAYWCSEQFVEYFKSQLRRTNEISRFKIVIFAGLCFRISGIWYYLLPCDTVWCGRRYKRIFFKSVI